MNRRKILRIDFNEVAAAAARIETEGPGADYYADLLQRWSRQLLRSASAGSIACGLVRLWRFDEALNGRPMVTLLAALNPGGVEYQLDRRDGGIIQDGLEPGEDGTPMRQLIKLAREVASGGVTLRGGSEKAETCIACDRPFVAGDLYHSDASGGHIHAECCGPERESYCDADGDPLGPDDPIPTPLVWKEMGDV